MQDSIITSIFLPVSLGIIMLGMGLSLSVKDFTRIVLYPKAAAIGIINQIIMLPLIGFLILLIIPTHNPELAVGLMILAACPGGPTSNLITHISKGDTALSISLTAISSIIIVITLPLIVNFALGHFLNQTQYVPLPVLDTSIKVLIITLIPVAIGMLIRSKAPGFSASLQKPVKIASGIILFLVIMAAIFNDRENFFDFFKQAGPVALALNVFMLLFGYFSARIFSLRTSQGITISIESGIQNGTLGITIAATLLNNATMTIPPAIYSLIMFMTAGIIIAWTNLKMKESPVKA